MPKVNIYSIVGLPMVDYCNQWTKNAKIIITDIERNQAGNIAKAAKIIKDSISKEHATFLFGSGHSALPVQEIYPRYGGIVGFIPMIELPLSFFTSIVGNMGFAQFDHLENDASYGAAILKSYTIHPQDSLVVFTHSGSTPVTLEVAIRFKEMGGKVIGVTSRHRSANSLSKHPTGKSIIDVADVLIDTGVPDSDVSIEIDKLQLGPLSSIGAIAVANLLSIKSAEQLIHEKKNISVNPVRAFDPDSEQKMDEILAKYRKLYSRHIGL